MQINTVLKNHCFPVNQWYHIINCIIVKYRVFCIQITTLKSMPVVIVVQTTNHRPNNNSSSHRNHMICAKQTFVSSSDYGPLCVVAADQQPSSG